MQHEPPARMSLAVPLCTTVMAAVGNEKHAVLSQGQLDALLRARARTLGFLTLYSLEQQTATCLSKIVLAMCPLGREMVFKEWIGISGLSRFRKCEFLWYSG